MNDIINYCITYKDLIISSLVLHIFILTLLPTVVGSILAVYMGIISVKNQRVSNILTGIASSVQVIPSIAILAILIVSGMPIGTPPAVVTVFLYTLLPVLNVTKSSISSIDESIILSSLSMGMSERQLVFMTLLPLSAPVIISVIRSVLIANMGIATVAAMVGSGGLGIFIYTGIQQYQFSIILVGVVPLVILSVLFDTILRVIGRRFEYE